MASALVATSAVTASPDAPFVVDHEILFIGVAPMSEHLRIEVIPSIASILPDDDGLTVGVHGDRRIGLGGRAGVVVDGGGPTF